MSYKYVAYTTDKRIEEGAISAANESMAEEALERAGYRILSLKQVKPRPSLEQLFPTFFGFKSQEVITFSRQLATLIESGIPLATALHLLEEQVTGAALRKIIAGLGEELQGGSSFSQALAKYPQVFSEIYRQIVGASEQVGNLKVALRQAASYMERGTAARQKAKRALAYPALVLLLAIGVVALLITAALPPLLGLFTELGAELPWTTRLLIAITSFLTGCKFHLLGAMLTLAVLVGWYVRQPAGRLMLDELLLKLPVIGFITIQSNMALFSRTMSVLLRAGLTLPQIMDIVFQTTGNRIIRHALKDVQRGLFQGQGLSQPMKANKLFPRLLVQMVMVGEQTGTLDSNLAILADFYEDEVNQKINGLISMLEPGMTIVIGLMVGFIALSLIMPMYSVLGSIK